MSRLRFAFLLCTALVVAACGDDENDPDDSSGDASSDDGGNDLLEPPAPGEGIQVGMTATLAPGVEAEQCRFVRPTEEEIWVSRDEIRFDTGSHHVLLYETPYESIPTVNENGVTVDTSGVFDCSDGVTDDWNVTKLVGGSQNGEGDSMIAFPPGVAMPIAAGAILILNVHYINASDKTLEPRVRINLHTVPKEEVETEGDLLFLYNPVIGVPAKGASRARWRCPVHQDITIANVQSHMHARGVGYAAMITGQDPFYESAQWANVPVKTFASGLEVAAGQTLDYYCDYQNGEDRAVYQGPRSTDEMCMLIGSYYPADPRIRDCQDEEGEQAGEWVGQGTATCAETLQCMSNADLNDGSLDGITDCMLAAAPSVSRETSDVLLCLLNGDPSGPECTSSFAACEAK